MQLFLMASKDNKSPMVMESVLLPCLKILQSLIKPDQPGSKKNKVRRQPNMYCFLESRKVLVEQFQHQFSLFQILSDFFVSNVQGHQCTFQFSFFEYTTCSALYTYSKRIISVIRTKLWTSWLPYDQRRVCTQIATSGWKEIQTTRLRLGDARCTPRMLRSPLPNLPPR